MFRYLYLSIILAMVGISCQTNLNPETMQNEVVVKDVHSFSEPAKAVVTHLNLQLNVDFEKHQLAGSARYNIDVKPGTDKIIFDTDDLQIEKVLINDNHETKFELGEQVQFLGRPLTVTIDDQTKSVTIFYSTSPDARALQWLSPEQTAQKEKPFLFTQSQAILARTWIPCQDSPGIRFTYKAEITVPEGFMAMMSAENPTEMDPDGVYEFNMPQRIPSYLMALTVGDLRFKPIGERTGVYAEPNMLEKCHYEFADMEKMLVSAEKIYGPYAWGRYDVVVLPPSFPFGGMENPRLTFATPTIIAGDRSLTSLVAHELAHSWSGNLVTNATWNDFWLNEGFTVYFEQRIMEEVYGRDYSEMLAKLSFESLQEEMKEISAKNPDDTKLKLNLENRDPDDGMNVIAYDKGYLFLRKIEETIGREKFDAFLRDYFKENAFKVMDTETFVELLAKQLSAEDSATIHPTAWIYGPGLPENHPVVQSDRFVKVRSELERWEEGEAVKNLNTDGWSTHEWLHFINSIPTETTNDKLAELDKTYGFTISGNSEIQSAWFSLVVPKNYEPANAAVAEFLNRVGRRKFLMPAYKALLKQDPSGDKARAIYSSARKNYHSVSTHSLDELLNWKSNG